jgi:hypothetical protein
VGYLGHALVENRHGLIAAAMVTHADGYAERDAALLMLPSGGSMHAVLVHTRSWSSVYGNPSPQKYSSQIHDFEWHSHLSRIRTDIPA